METNKIDLTHTDIKITVLRGFNSGKFLVVQGDSFYSGLSDKYREFASYHEAIYYFYSIII